MDRDGIEWTPQWHQSGWGYHGALAMSDASSTSLTLLKGLLDPTDTRAWKRFDERYRPVLVNFALQLGLAGDDAEEIAQRASVAFFESYRRGHYDRSKGRLKNWLLGIAQHQIADYYAERARQPIAPAGRSELEARLGQLRDPDEFSSIWDRQWEAHVLTICVKRAAAKFSARDIRVFKMVTSEGRSPAQVARRLGISQTNVATIKHRVLSYIKGCREDVERGV